MRRKKKSKLSWQDEYKISMAAFKVANIMIDCKYAMPISNLQREIETLKRENKWRI